MCKAAIGSGRVEQYHCGSRAWLRERVVTTTPSWCSGGRRLATLGGGGETEKY